MSGMDRKTLRAPEIILKCLIIKLLKASKKIPEFLRKGEHRRCEEKETLEFLKGDFRTVSCD